MQELQKIMYVLTAVRKHFKLFSSIIVVGMAITVGINLFVLTPKYSSSVQMIVQADETDMPNSVSTINGNVLMVNTYKDLIKGDVVMDDVQKELRNQGLTLTTSQLNQTLQITQSPNSQMFMIKAVSDTPRHAAMIVNTTAKVFKDKAAMMMSIKQVTISSYGKENLRPTAPRVKYNLLLGGGLSFLFGLALAFLLELSANKVMGKTMIEDEFGLSLLGIVTFVK